MKSKLLGLALGLPLSIPFLIATQSRAAETPSAAGPATTAVTTAATTTAGPKFTIERFEFTGNSILSKAAIDAVLSPHAGPDRQYSDVEMARAAVEKLYTSQGHEFVRVLLPEQELRHGVIHLLIIEARISKVIVTGNAFFDEQNIRSGLPSLTPGAMPDLRKLSAGTQLMNENPARQIKVTLGTLGASQTPAPAGSAEAAKAGDIEAIVDVSDSNPQRLFFTLDNTGTAASGRYRTGVAYQHANLFNLDHQASIAYTTSPDSPSGVNVNMFSLGYRLPLYALGDSLELIYGKSSVNTPSSSPTLGGVLGINGKGDILGLRWNHYLARSGDQTARLVFGIDNKNIDAKCTMADGSEVSYAAPTPPISGCVPYRTRPLSISYAGQIQRVGETIDYGVGLSWNLATGTRYTNLDGRVDRYSYLTPGNRSSRDDFRIVRANGGYVKTLPADWQLRLLANAQYSPDPLLAAEQFGLAGSYAVRGMDERAVTTDSGVLLNAELYGPDLAGKASLPGNLRSLVFFDAAKGFNQNTAGTLLRDTTYVSSAGGGIRYSLNRSISLRIDIARVLRSGTSSTETRGDWRTQLSLVIGS